MGGVLLPFLLAAAHAPLPLHDACAARLPLAPLLSSLTAVIVGARSANGATALHACAAAGHAVGLRDLLTAGADIEALDAQGATPLLSACAAGQAEAIELLLGAGAAHGARTRHGVSCWTMVIGRPLPPHSPEWSSRVVAAMRAASGTSSLNALPRASSLAVIPPHMSPEIAGAEPPAPVALAAARGQFALSCALLAAGASHSVTHPSTGRTLAMLAADAPPTSCLPASLRKATAAAAAAAAIPGASRCASGQRILSREVRPWRAVNVTTPPATIPPDLLWAYTRCSTIPVSPFVINDAGAEGRGTWYVHDAADISRRIRDMEKELSVAKRMGANPPRGGRASSSMSLLVRAVAHPRAADVIKGGSCVVFGSSAPSIEALLLAAGASRVLTIEYNNLTYHHDSITTSRPEEVRAAWAHGGDAAEGAVGGHRRHSFDCAVSASSFDHDGLGRYGDPLAPDGDLMSMDSLHDFLKREEEGGGIALVSVPIGPDLVLWNAMRRYGRVRLPLLLDGWNVLERVGWEGDARLDSPPGVPRGPSFEPVFILGEGRGGEHGKREVEEL